jgi:hypothetical protein
MTDEDRINNSDDKPAANMVGDRSDKPTANMINKDSSWGKPPESGKQQSKNKRLSVFYNLLTVLLTAVIIAGGFMLPPLLSPYLDSYHNELVQLDEPSDKYVFEKQRPPGLWDRYDEDNLRALTVAEQDFLDSHGIPNFLIDTLRYHGMLLPADLSPYYSQILNSFRCLALPDSTVPDYFVLMDADIDSSGTPDLRCAVDPDGNIISLRFISDEWGRVQLVTPIVDPAAVAAAGQAAAENVTGGNAGTGTSGGADDGTTTGDPDLVGPDATAQPEAATPEATAGTGAQDAAGTGGAGGASGAPGTNNTGGAGDNPAVDYRPLEEDENIWSFAYATSREAKLVNQLELFTAFRQLELSYEGRFGYAYTKLLPIQSDIPETLPDVGPASLSPRKQNISNNYQLYYYRLPSGEWLRLYINLGTMRCMGFEFSN